MSVKGYGKQIIQIYRTGKAIDRTVWEIVNNDEFKYETGYIDWCGAKTPVWRPINATKS